MPAVREEQYPLITSHDTACRWLRTQANLQLAPKTVDTYARSLEDYLTFCRMHEIDPQTVTREHVALYVNDLADRPNPRARNILHIDSGVGLANATMQLRVTVVRLYYDFLMEMGLRDTNPVGRGKFTPGRAFGGKRERGLVPRYKRMPWVPNDEQWLAILQELHTEPLRNRVMVLLAYECALRREELVSLRVTDIDLPHRQVTIRPEIAKNRIGRIVFYGQTTGLLLAHYLRHRRLLSRDNGPIFLSESRQNRGSPLSTRMVNKIIARIVARAGSPQFSPHTLRHLRLTHMARAGLDVHTIATFAGHRSIETTMIYIHLSGRELADKVAMGMAHLDTWLATATGGQADGRACE